MLKYVLAVMAIVVTSPLHAQDIVGLEDCSKATSADKKSGCLQSNVAFLHALIKKNEAAAQAQLKATQAQLIAADAKAGALKGEVERLRLGLEQLEKRLDLLEKKAPKK